MEFKYALILPDFLIDSMKFVNEWKQKQIKQSKKFLCIFQNSVLSNLISYFSSNCRSRLMTWSSNFTIYVVPLCQWAVTLHGCKERDIIDFWKIRRQAFFFFLKSWNMHIIDISDRKMMVESRNHIVIQ